jgi:hypothetical protein
LGGFAQFWFWFVDDVGHIPFLISERDEDGYSLLRISILDAYSIGVE